MMNLNWTKLFNAINKHERLIVGLMSGTSLDGLDIALCAITDHGVKTKLKVLHFQTMEYEIDFKDQIKSVFSKRQVDLQMVSLLNEKIGLVHGSMVLTALEMWGGKPEDVDAIASHGQTIFHAPKSLHQLADYPNATLQIGDGDHIAVKTGIVTISDFRQKHIAAGGEGAPLAVYGDYLLFSKKDEERILLNIGGIANFTYLPEDNDADKVFSTDVGPGNTIMDQFVQKHYVAMAFDAHGDLAASGNINAGLLAALMDLDFFATAFPKTTGPELFNLVYLEAAQDRSDTLNISKEDVLATLNRFSAEVIIEAICRCVSQKNKTKVYVSGGGAHNSLLISHLKKALFPMEFGTTAELGINPDAKEAVLFAVLANETLSGTGVDFDGRAALPAITMGKICLPF
ncbi:anhydro-N-acetylmuramic acid kinase [Pedobacter sp. UYP24]